MTKAAELAKMGEVLTNSQIGGRRNIIINGAMQVAQRGTSTTGLGANAESYDTVDRIKLGFAGSTAGRLTASQSTDAPNGFSNSFKLQCTTADTSVAAGEYALIQYLIEGQDLQQLKKGTSDAEKVTISFYVKGNANATYTLELYDADNARQISKTFSVTSSWNRITLTYDGDTTGAFNNDNGLSLYLFFWIHAGSTYTGGTLSETWTAQTSNQRASSSGTSFFDSTDRTFFITGLQMEVGSQATPFEHRSFGEELALCQRYYQTLTVASTYREISTTEYADFFSFNTTMRASPTAAVKTQFKYWNVGTATNVTPTFDTKTNGSNITMSSLTSGRGFNAGEASFDSEL